jgi:co-chaperonin GroES (HSP10)
MLREQQRLVKRGEFGLKVCLDYWRNLMIQATLHRVILKPDPLEEEVDLGNGKKLAIAYEEGGKRERYSVQVGTIVDVGPDAWKAFRQLDDNGRERPGLQACKAGDRVYFAKHSGHVIVDPENGEEFFLVNDEDITALITGKELYHPHTMKRKT